MRGNADRLRKLLTEGYEIVEVESDHRVIRATLKRGWAVVSLRFSREDAGEFLATPRRLPQ